MTPTQQASVDRILRLRHTLALHFREEQWATLGELTGCPDLVHKHDRLGSIHWGDNAYDTCVLNVLMAMVDRCPEALPRIEQYAAEVCGDTEANSLASATLTRV